MTNETPDNTHSTPADLPAGQHDFGATLSSESVAAVPAPVPASEPAPVVEPEREPAAEPTVSSGPDQTIPPVDDPLVASPVEAPAPAHETPTPPYEVPAAPPYDPAAEVAVTQNGTHILPAGGQQAGGQQAGGQQAGVYPNGGHTNGGYPAGGHPAGAYPVAAPAPAPKKPMSKGLLFGIIGGAVLLVLLIAAVIIVPALLRGPAQTASGVVEEYLTAVSEGDAETALTFVETYADDSLLTDEALAASLELAPITDIEVEEPEDVAEYGSTMVSATFEVGGETVEREFEVYNYDDDWTLYDGLVTATIGNFEGLGLTVNGIEPGDTSMSLFPGTYQLALGYDEFVIDSDTDTFTLTVDEDAEAFWDLQPVLTEDGVATFRTLVRASFEECVAMKSLSTPCGMDITDIDLSGYTPVDGTVTRTITDEGQQDLDELEPEADYSKPTVVSTYDSIDVDMTLQGTKDGATSEFEVWFGGYMNRPSVDFAEETPTVTWE